MKIQKLVTLFSSLFLIYVIALIGAWYVSHAFKDHLLKQEAISDAVHWAEFVATQSPQIKGELAQGQISKQTIDALQLASHAGVVFRYKLFDSSGIVVHALRPEDVGKLNTKPYFETLVRKGKTFAKIATGENFGEQRSTVSEAYVPHMEGGRFQGAIKVYVDETIKAARLEWVRQLVFWSVAALVLGIAMVWGFFVWRAFIGRDQALAELHQRDAELTDQNERFNTALENMSQGLCLYDSGQRLIVANERYASIYGLSLELMKPGTTLRQILEYRIAKGYYAGENPEAYIQKQIEWVSSGVCESKIQELSDGRSIAITLQPMAVGGWVATHEDVTESKRISDLLRATVDSFPGGISVIDSNLKLTMANDRFYQLLDLPEDLLPVGCLYEDIIRVNAERGDYGAGDPEEMVRERVALSRKFEEHSFERRRPDGTVLEIRGFPLPQGGFVSTYVDITERKDAEVLNLRLARIVEDSINEVFVFDTETLKFLQVNASACRNLGYTMEEMVKLTPIDLKPEFTLEQFEDAIAPLRRGEVNHFRFQTAHRRKDGSLYDADIVLQQIESGDQPVFAAIIEDITERKNVERELVEHRDHLQELVGKATQKLKVNAEELKVALAREQELSKLQRQFVTMASHEFRTPLAIIDATAQRMKSQAAKNRLKPEDAIARVEKIRDAVKRMTRLMESTLDAARMEDGKINIEIGECDLRYVLLEVLTNQIELSPNHNISCDLKELPNMIQGDRGALTQVFTNLLSNAVKYAPDAPDIEVKARTEGDQVVISVRDHGMGIDEDELGRIGERFFRAKTSTGIAGTGIGLNLVKMLVEMHGGSVNVESQKGVGSTFTIRLPIARQDQSEQADNLVA